MTRSAFLRGLVVAIVLVFALVSETSSAERSRSFRPLWLAQNWDQLSPGERDEALRNYQRFQRLPPEKQKAVERNYDRWRQLPPQEKERIRTNYRRYREMSPDERRDFHRRYEEWRGGR